MDNSNIIQKLFHIIKESVEKARATAEENIYLTDNSRRNNTQTAVAHATTKYHLMSVSFRNANFFALLVFCSYYKDEMAKEKEYETTLSVFEGSGGKIIIDTPDLGYIS